jgi:hypothetical protein
LNGILQCGGGISGGGRGQNGKVKGKAKSPVDPERRTNTNRMDETIE